VTIIEQGNMTK